MLVGQWMLLYMALYSQSDSVNGDSFDFGTLGKESNLRIIYDGVEESIRYTCVFGFNSKQPFTFSSLVCCERLEDIFMKVRNRCKGTPSVTTTTPSSTTACPTSTASSTSCYHEPSTPQQNSAASFGSKRQGTAEGNIFIIGSGDRESTFEVEGTIDYGGSKQMSYLCLFGTSPTSGLMAKTEYCCKWLDHIFIKVRDRCQAEYFATPESSEEETSSREGVTAAWYEIIDSSSVATIDSETPETKATSTKKRSHIREFGTAFVVTFFLLCILLADVEID